ncbi:hypothetical protein LLEC1_02232 [Akanthomyces lecanii]|uniref:Gamma-glutamyltransferase n=1 Tax=Cordyceps confragosa TaxID=2714763 RepID=A0A179I227_CORDF|nr:hypothetical protein LLEC1_02232 [Akanthomyces lecanii]
MPLTSNSVFQEPSLDQYKYASRRSVVHSTEGIVSCSQPLAAKCGLDVLRAGGNAANSGRSCCSRYMIPTMPTARHSLTHLAAGLNLTEPCSTGIGGDMFILFWDAKSKEVKAMNGSGRSGAKYGLDHVRAKLGLKDGDVAGIPKDSPFSITVPGAAAGWVDTVERFGSGRVDLARILAPAIELGEKGFPVSEVAGYSWMASEKQIRNASPNFAEMLKKDPSAEDGVRAPRPGEIMKNPTLAQTFRTLAAEGKAGFYTGRIGEALVKVVQDLGGDLSLEDLQHHLETGSEPVEPISLKFRGQGQDADAGIELWEHPPNGQGIVALMALGIIQELEKQGKIPTFGPQDVNTTPYLHALIEALRISFADGSWFVADPNVSKVPAAELISESYLAERAKLFDPTKAFETVHHSDPSSASPALRSSDTPDNAKGWTVGVEEGMPAETIEGLKRLGHNVNVVTGRGRALFGRGQIIRYVVDPVDKTPIWSAGSDPRADGGAYPL